MKVKPMTTRLCDKVSHRLTLPYYFMDVANKGQGRDTIQLIDSMPRTGGGFSFHKFD